MVEADNREFWQTMAAKLASLQAQPSSSQQATEVGNALAALQAVLLEEDNDAPDYDLDWDGDADLV
jgi:hypothetical protein